MRKVLGVGFVVLLLSALALRLWFPTSEWKEYTFADGKCSVWFPDQPQQREVPTETTPLTMYAVKIDARTAYSVQFGDLPIPDEDLAWEGFADGQLRTSRDGMVRHAQGVLRNESKITIGPYPGIEFLIETPHGLVIRNRLYLVRKRIYIVNVGGVRQSVSSPDADRFLDSFKLLD